VCGGGARCTQTRGVVVCSHLVYAGAPECWGHVTVCASALEMCRLAVHVRAETRCISLLW